MESNWLREFSEEKIRDEIDADLISKGISNILNTLENDREVLVLRCRFWDGLTLEATGKIIRVQKERVRQIEANALRKLRNPKREELFYKIGVPWVEDIRRKRAQEEIEEDKERLRRLKEEYLKHQASKGIREEKERKEREFWERQETARKQELSFREKKWQLLLKIHSIHCLNLPNRVVFPPACWPPYFSKIIVSSDGTQEIWNNDLSIKVCRDIDPFSYDVWLEYLVQVQHMNFSNSEDTQARQ